MHSPSFIAMRTHALHLASIVSSGRSSRFCILRRQPQENTHDKKMARDVASGIRGYVDSQSVMRSIGTVPNFIYMHMKNDYAICRSYNPG